MVDSKLYPTFQPKERLTLILEAMARQDDPEVERLRESCPRATYTQIDAAFEERLRLAFELLAVSCIDLRAMWAKLYMIEWSKEVLAHFAPLHHITATLGFVDGVRCANGLAQSPFFRPKPDRGNDDPDEPELTQHEGQCDRMFAVEERAEGATADMLGVFDSAAKAIAQALVNMWAAFDRFCTSRLGLDGPAVFRAWQMPLLEDIGSTLKLHRDVKPQLEKVSEYRRLIDMNWDRRFGGGGTDEEGDGDGE